MQQSQKPAFANKVRFLSAPTEVMLEMSASKSYCGKNLTPTHSFDTKFFCFTSPSTQHHSFLELLIPFLSYSKRLAPTERTKNPQFSIKTIVSYSTPVRANLVFRVFARVQNNTSLDSRKIYIHFYEIQGFF